MLAARARLVAEIPAHEVEWIKSMARRICRNLQEPLDLHEQQLAAYPKGGLDLDNAIGYVLHRAEFYVRREIYAAFRASGLELTPEQALVMTLLWEQAGCSFGDLALATLRDLPTLSRIVDSLEEQGLIRRQPDASDRRMRRAWPTPLGECQEEPVMRALSSVEERIRRGLGRSEIERLRELLQIFGRNLEGPG